MALKPDFHLHKREKNPSYMALLGPTLLLISEKSATYTIKWSYTIIWQVRVVDAKIRASDKNLPASGSLQVGHVQFSLRVTIFFDP